MGLKHGFVNTLCTHRTIPVYIYTDLSKIKKSPSQYKKTVMGVYAIIKLIPLEGKR